MTEMTTGPRRTDARADGHAAGRALNFTGDHVAVTVVAGAGEHRVDGRAIVVNCGVGDAYVDEPPRRPVPPLTSTIVTDTTIGRADLLLVLRVRDEMAGALGGITDEPGWTLLGEVIGDAPGDTGGLPFDRRTPLWRSPQDVVGRVEVDPARLLRETAAAGPRQPFEVKANLWFAPAGTDCFIHNRHDFIEVHTQVAGFGRMQKFTEQDHSTLYQDVLMSPGYTTPDPFCSTGPDHSYLYPWHQYYADTDCVWLAIEYHRVAR